ncbi:hypothetical protein PHYBLDRAFT_66431 [Phycomyces blakesleeanus NRRL 1555(-)]|uniref:Uncharacterized protein n=1 Tax=Phycomyces blakesleeanus (strain ATCC 8743b / DSM 1359 / FGSC 10004 / NBRC 33097 / NRRL 1555) TaxID=763407 RepID=A0A162TVG0_PHYB8|nr:hypothetical protein PHYBLDRAFT_66431 [Phycomyces blakesleeanus NRRL 1555(-)]OAD71302.1 hypothetical protein PHYBLDRAFT_66431 [Phycomyces blakesleeanus NRRL 1555(-)]|eukprot:XP_018289342.1 hypothetical protein PHYBLDRAFT_66431 [Phycomyces blakesleeanus NRRL 1555(-)]
MARQDCQDLHKLAYNMTLAKIISCYLKIMRKAIHKLIPELYTTCTKHAKYRYCMSVPTIWSKESKNIMREAAIMTGSITRYNKPEKLSIVDEAVAPFLYSERM